MFDGDFPSILLGERRLLRLKRLLNQDTIRGGFVDVFCLSWKQKSQANKKLVILRSVVLLTPNQW